jgi:DNA-binding MarR family transcriptional regulator
MKDSSLDSSRDLAQEMARDCLALRARRLERTLTRIYDGALRGVGVTGSQLTMLVALELMKDATAAALGAELDLEKSTVSRNLARLAAAGLVDTRDGLRLTARGAAALRAGHAAWRKAQAQARAQLGARPLALLSSLLPEGSP